MTAAFAWLVGIAFAVWACRLLWKARRDAQLKKMMAAGMAGEVAGDAIGGAFGDSSCDSDNAGSCDSGGDGGDGGE